MSVARETFTTSHLAEFCSARELTAATGTAPSDWAAMIIREAVDNALDQAEEVGIAPRISVTVARGRIRVRDNGRGIPAETVASILDFSARTSSRAAYISPSRGQQGAALAFIIAIPFALSGEEGRVDIEACGVRHEILFRADEVSRAPAIEHRQIPVSVRTGTSITVWWPESAWSDVERAGARFFPLLSRFTDLNPHLSICATWVDEGRREQWTCAAVDPAWTKWTPSAPTSPHWYRPADLERLAAAFIARDRQRRSIRLLRDFLGQFDGLSGTGKRADVLAALDLQRAPLERLLREGTREFNHQLVAELLQAMQAVARPIRPEKLGPLGRDNVAAALAGYGGDPETFRYKLLKGVDAGVPWIVEAAFAYLPEAESRQLCAGLNWSPALDPAGDHFRLGAQLTGAYCGPHEPIAVLAHLICPRPEFVDRGKTTLAAHCPGYAAVQEAVAHVTGAWAKQRVGEIRNRSRERNRQEKLRLSPVKPVSIKDVMLAHLAEAIRETSGDGRYEFGERQLFYALRPIVQREAGKPLVIGTFKSILTEYENETGDIPGMYRKPRGYIYHPHSGEEIPLGTVNVRNYTRPALIFNKLLYSEKEGLLNNLRATGWPERHDCALATTEGFTTRAIRDLIDALSESIEPITVYCIHDADAYGTMIYQTLQEETKVRPRRKIEVVNLGLELWEAIDLGLEVEKFPKSDNDRPVADYVKARPDGLYWARRLQTERVELNELKPAQFIEWITGKFEQLGIGKVVPPANLALLLLQGQAERIVKDALIGELTRRARIEARAAELMSAIRWPDWPAADAITKAIAKSLKRRPQVRWSEPLYRFARKLVKPLLSAIIAKLDKP